MPAVLIDYLITNIGRNGDDIDVSDNFLRVDLVVAVSASLEREVTVTHSGTTVTFTDAGLVNDAADVEVFGVGKLL